LILLLKQLAPVLLIILDVTNIFFQNFGNSGTLTYDLRASGLGYGMKMGKMNLDSIKTAPPDSIFYLNDGKIDVIHPDSLSSRIGNVYIIKTGTDPRPAWTGTYYAKIKILGFKVIDSVKHEIEMRFLWAFQRDQSQNVTTSGLDTFHLSTPVISGNTSSASRKYGNNSQPVFKVVGDRFVVPKEFLGSGAFLSIYNLAGKRLGRVAVGNGQGVVDIRSLEGIAKSVVVVRVEQ
jgi:hypothetical protein